MKKIGGNKKNDKKEPPLLQRMAAEVVFRINYRMYVRLMNKSKGQ